jgi:hypothetical protein
MHFFKYFGKLIGLLLAFAVTISIMLPCFVYAADFEGAGTASSPYLIKTAEQLNKMRNSGNLSAYFKLANTIDMSTVTDFKPIGYIAKPFKGTFICELGTDGFPKYAIKNLKVAVPVTAVMDDPNWKSNWPKGEARMEAALFGATDGARITNIYVLNVSISNDNFGGNQGAAQYGNYTPGQDEKNAAGLIGIAKNTTVTGCATTGKIDAKPNHVGGLIGFAENCTIAKSYSKVNIKNIGLWGVGGLIGSANFSNISQCFATGNVDSVAATSGGFVGSVDSSKFTDCYSTGDVTKSGSNFTGRFLGTPTYTNCFALGNGGTRVWQPDEVSPTTTIANCHILSGKTNSQQQFKASSAADIKTAFSSLTSVWDASGNYPTLKNVKILTDEGKYVPGTGANSNTSSQTSSDTTTNETTDNSNTTVKAASVSVEEIITWLNALPNDPELITLDNKADIVKLYTAYKALDDASSEKIEQKEKTKINMLYNAISLKIMEDIVNKVGKLPEANKLKASDKANVLAIKADFDFIPKENQEAIDEGIRTKLSEAVKAVEKFSDLPEVSHIQSELSVFDWVLIISLSILILLVLSATIFMTVVVIKNKIKS